MRFWVHVHGVSEEIRASSEAEAVKKARQIQRQRVPKRERPPRSWDQPHVVLLTGTLHKGLPVEHVSDTVTRITCPNGHHQDIDHGSPEAADVARTAWAANGATICCAEGECACPGEYPGSRDV